MSNKLLTFCLLIATIVYNQANASNNINSNEQNNIINECFMMTENDKKELMNLNIENYDIDKEGEDIVKQIDYFKDKSGKYTIKKDDFFYNCKKIWPENEYMSLLDIAKKYNMDMQNVIQSYNRAYFKNSAKQSDKILFENIINYINEGNHTILDAAKQYSVNIRAIDDMYGKVVHLNKDNKYISNEQILKFIADKSTHTSDKRIYTKKRNINDIAKHFELNQNTVLAIISKLSVFNSKNGYYITYSDILNKIEDTKKSLSEIAKEFGLEINTIQQIYKRGTVLLSASNRTMREDILNYLYNNYTPEQIINDICKTPGEGNILKREISEIEQRYGMVKYSTNQNLSNIIYSIHNNIINCIQNNKQISLYDIAENYNIPLEDTEVIFRNTIIKNDQQKEILIDDILNYHIYNKDYKYTSKEILTKISSNPKLLTDKAYLLNSNGKLIKVHDIKNAILQEIENDKLNLKIIANRYDINIEIMDIIFRTLKVNNYNSQTVLINDILNYISECSNISLGDSNKIFNQNIDKNLDFEIGIIVGLTAGEFSIHPKDVQYLILKYRTIKQ